MKTLCHITLFAELEARWEDRPTYHPQIRRSGPLLAYLAYYHDRSHSREELAALFWPHVDRIDGDRIDTRGKVRTSVRELRKHLDRPGTPLSESVILGTWDSLRLNLDEAQTDVALYRQALWRAKRARTDAERLTLLEYAVGLYVGPLLPRLLDEWVEGARNLLAGQQQAALSQIITLHEQAGRMEGAIARAQQAIALENTNETAHCRLMSLYIADARYAEALAQYERLERALQSELCLPPSPQAVELAHKARHLRLTSVSLRNNSLPVSVSNRIFGGKRESAPAGKSSPALRVSNMPVPLTVFIDRGAELRRCHLLLTRPGTRLLTLSGPGGTGKTRLGVEAARRVKDAFGGRVFWVELAPLEDAGRIVDAVADALLPYRRAGADVIQQLMDDVGDTRLLLVLDNFEHLAEAGGASVTALLRALPGLTILVTSRQLLRVDGEQAFPVKPLDLAPSLALFANRARLARPEWTLNAANEQIVTVLCARLEGIPLAIELAAAWMDTLTPVQILERLDQRFVLLVSPRKDISDRHRSLYATINWSYEQLSPGLQRTFLCLSIFQGGWTLDAAQAVCQSEANAHDLRQLLDRSLICADAPDPASEETRYAMLESLREFAGEQLSGAARSELANARAACFLRFAETADPHLRGPEQIAWLNRLEADHDNLRASLRHLHDTRQAQTSWRLAGALGRFWQMRGHITEGREHLARALALQGEPTPARAYALRQAGLLASDQDDALAALPLFEESLALARQLQDRVGEAWAIYSVGANFHSRGSNAQALVHLHEALTLFETLGERRGVASALHKIGSALLPQGLYEEAMPCFARAADLFEQLGNRQSRAVSLLNVGNVYMWRDEDNRAQLCYEESLTAFEAVGNEWLAAVVKISLAFLAHAAGAYDRAEELLTQAVGEHRRHGARIHEAWALYHLGSNALLQGRAEQASACYLASLTLLHNLGQKGRAAHVLLGIAWLAQEQGRPERAARLQSAGLSLLQRSGTIADVSIRRRQHVIAATRHALGEQAYAAYQEQGQTFTWEQAIDDALQEL